MTTFEAQKVLQEFNAWRRYGGPDDIGPDCPSPTDIGEAIDVAVAILKSINHKPEKEYYGC